MTSSLDTGPHVHRSPHGSDRASGAGRPGHAPEHDTDLAELLDLDAVLGASVLSTALDAASGALAAAQPPGAGHHPAVHLAVDLGAGTGTGTLALAARFVSARITSLDASPAMLGRLAAAASAAGVADRVDPHPVDLDGDWPAVLPRPADLAWAALSLHHVSDPARVLQQAFDALRPGGVLVVIEMTSTASYAPTDLGTGRDGLGERLVGALRELGYPVMAEWTSALAAAGFAPVERVETAFTASSDTVEGARYLARLLARNRSALDDALLAQDLAALDGTIAALDAGTSPVLGLTTGRAVWIATRPAHTPTHTPDAHTTHAPTTHTPTHTHTHTTGENR